MKTNIKILISTIFIGFGITSSVFASDPQDEEKIKPLHLIAFPDHLFTGNLFKEDFELFQMYNKLYFTDPNRNKSIVDEKTLQAEKKNCLPLVPTEILAYILKFLPPAQFEEVSVVCKRFHRITHEKNHLLWHLSSNLTPDSYLSLNINILKDLGQILSDTMYKDQDRRIHMVEKFEQKHLTEIKASFRALNFYKRVLTGRKISIFEHLGSCIFTKAHQNEFTSQKVLEKSYILIQQISDLINENDSLHFNVKLHLQSRIDVLLPLISRTQTSTLERKLVQDFDAFIAGLHAEINFNPARFFIPIPMENLAENNNNLNDDQQDID